MHDDDTAPRLLGNLMTPAEAAAKLGVQMSTMAAWRTSGKGPIFTKVGGAVRYAPADIERWLQSRRSAATPAERRSSATR